MGCLYNRFKGVKNAPTPRPNKRPRAENAVKDTTAAAPSLEGENADHSQPAVDISDMDWLKAHRGLQETEMKSFEQSDDEDKDPDGKGKPVQKDLLTVAAESSLDLEESTKQTILSTRRLFVRNLTFSCTNEELKELFGEYGAIEQVK